MAAWLFGRLPGGFAIPEGLGDAVAAAGALALLPSLRRGTESRTWLLVWNTFGLVDLLSALMVGVLSSNGPLGVLSRGGVTTELMVTFPVSLIPTFLVPLFILLHLLTFARLARHQVLTERDDAIAESEGGGSRALTFRLRGCRQAPRSSGAHREQSAERSGTEVLSCGRLLQPSALRFGPSRWRSPASSARCGQLLGRLPSSLAVTRASGK